MEGNRAPMEISQQEVLLRVEAVQEKNLAFEIKTVQKGVTTSDEAEVDSWDFVFELL